MKKLNKLSIKICIFASALILAVIAVMAHQILDEAKASLITEVKLRAGSFARSSREAFSPKLDLFSLHLLVSEMAKERAVKYALVTDASGKVLSHSVPEKVGETETSPAGKKALLSGDSFTQVFRDSDGLEYYYISNPVALGGERLATAAVALNTQTINATLKPARDKIILISLFALLIAITGTILIVNWLISPLPLLVRAAQAVGEGHLEETIKWKSADEIGLLTDAFNNMVKGLRDRDHIRNVFGRYVSKDIADTVLNGKLALGGERREIAVLFADIRNFTKMSTHMEPEQLVQVLNSYFSGMTRVIHGHGGTIDKFVGDGILAIFGAPLPMQNAAFRAVRTALAMQDELKAMNAERAKSGLAPIETGICVTFGTAVVGNIGSEARVSYTSIGAPVNLASRLEGLNKRLGTRIITSAQLRAAVGDSVETRALGEHQIRGWDEPVEVFEVLGIKGKEAGR